MLHFFPHIRKKKKFRAHENLKFCLKHYYYRGRGSMKQWAPFKACFYALSGGTWCGDRGPEMLGNLPRSHSR